MSDEKFEEFLHSAAQRYNEPPVQVPRDELFAAITAARRVATAVPARPANGTRTIHYTWIGIAAALVIGVAIGKFLLTKPDVSTRTSFATQPDASPSGAGRDASGSPKRMDGSASVTPADAGGRASYAKATTTELARAEALLTAYGAAAPNAGVDRQLSTWARDILSNTRLLLDSPAADDPARRRLLQDLELVLVQMVQRSPTAGVDEERSHIDRSLEHTHVLARLRSALPAGLNN